MQHYATRAAPGQPVVKLVFRLKCMIEEGHCQVLLDAPTKIKNSFFFD